MSSEEASGYSLEEEEGVRTEVYAAYGLYSGPELDPNQITALTGITPSKTWRIGDLRIPQAKVRRKHNGWYLKSDLPLTAELEEHVKSVLDRLRPGWDVLVQLGSKHEAEIDCVVEIYGVTNPGIHFDGDVVKRIAELSAAIDIDIYILD